MAGSFAVAPRCVSPVAAKSNPERKASRTSRSVMIPTNLRERSRGSGPSSLQIWLLALPSDDLQARIGRGASVSNCWSRFIAYMAASES